MPAPSDGAPRLTRDDRHDILWPLFPTNPRSRPCVAQSRSARCRSPSPPSCWRPATTSQTSAASRRPPATSTSSRSARRAARTSCAWSARPRPWRPSIRTSGTSSARNRNIGGRPGRGSPSRTSSRSRSTIPAASQNIKYYDLKDAQNITMVARITPTSGKELTVLEQILGNVGKFSGPAAGIQSWRTDRRRLLSCCSREAKKKPRSCDRGFSVGGRLIVSARARRAAAGPRCW